MAFASGTYWEVQNGGSDANGGGWDSASSGTDKTLTAAVSRTDLVIDGTTNTKITSAGTPFAATDVGNVINITAGTGFTVQRVQVVSVLAAVATCDKAVGTLSSTGGSGALGGALATPGLAAGLLVQGNTIWIKYNATAYTTSSASSNVAGGIISTSTLTITIQGYDVTRGDFTANRPTFKAGNNSIRLIKLTDNRSWVVNLIADAGSATTVSGIQVGANCGAYKCKVNGANDSAGDAFRVDSVGELIACEVTSCTARRAYNINGGSLFGCVANNYVDGGTQDGIFVFVGTGGTAVDCVCANVSGAAAFAFFNLGVASSMVCVNCIAYKNTSGFSNSGIAQACVMVNCVAYGNTGTPPVGFATSLGSYLFNCAYDGATQLSAGVNNYNGVVLSADPFTNGTGGDFSLNSTAGGGAALKGTGFLGTFPTSVSSTGYQDIGAVQHQTVAGGLLVSAGLQGGCNG